MLQLYHLFGLLFHLTRQSLTKVILGFMIYSIKAQIFLKQLTYIIAPLFKTAIHHLVIRHN